MTEGIFEIPIYQAEKRETCGGDILFDSLDRRMFKERYVIYDKVRENYEGEIKTGAVVYDFRIGGVSGKGKFEIEPLTSEEKRAFRGEVLEEDDEIKYVHFVA